MRRLLPNAITIVRLVLLAPFVWAVASDRPTLAFWLLASMAASDGVDGYLARRWRAVTPLGVLLDPVADKVTQVVGLLLLAAAGTPGFTPIPRLFVALVLARDLVLAYGTLRVRRHKGTVHIQPRWEGKTSTLLVFALMLCSCLAAPPRVVTALAVVAAPLVVAAGIRYVRAGLAQVQ